MSKIVEVEEYKGRTTNEKTELKFKTFFIQLRQQQQQQQQQQGNS